MYRWPKEGKNIKAILPKGQRKHVVTNRGKINPWDLYRKPQSGTDFFFRMENEKKKKNSVCKRVLSGSCAKLSLSLTNRLGSRLKISFPAPDMGKSHRQIVYHRLRGHTHHREGEWIALTWREIIRTKGESFSSTGTMKNRSGWRVTGDEWRWMGDKGWMKEDDGGR